MIGQLSILEAGPAPDPSASQWFTEPRLARELVALAGPMLEDARRRGYPLHVLEPSAGRGNLIRAVLERHPRAWIDAVDIDARWRADLEQTSGVEVEIIDYLARPAPDVLYDLAVCNVPFDGGEEGPHLQKLLNEAERICALLPTRSLHGTTRYRQIWHRFDPRRTERDWWIRQRVNLVARPKFGEAGGSDEIVLLDLRRVPGPCEERWL